MTLSAGTLPSGCIFASSITDGDGKGTEFAKALLNAVKAKYPTTDLNHTAYKGADVTYRLLTGTESNSFEFLFFFGHGGYGSVCTGDCERSLIYANCIDGAIDNSGNLNIGQGFTKWMIFHSCLTLGYDPNVIRSNGIYYYQNLFKGVHAVLGFASIGYNLTMSRCKKYTLWWCSSYYKSDVDLYEDFANKFIKQDQWIGLAWINAVINAYADNGVGVEVKAMGVQGQILSGGVKTPFIGYMEKCSEALTIETPMSIYQTDFSKQYWVPDCNGFAVSTYSCIYGTPKYEAGF